ncbi:MAG: site-specific DNA-methyltransferase [Planctomycetaceae bacterium]|nr:site-specific DNA-methyltransferase [Planctomycetaceae bacterium]
MTLISSRNPVSVHSRKIGRSIIFRADCIEWLGLAAKNSIHSVVTDPPYGVKEFDEDQLHKRSNGRGGIWRIPPSFDGHKRAPLPRFTALNDKERRRLFDFFRDWTKALLPVMCPGAHVFIATNAFISQLLYSALIEGGLEFRGEIIRLVRTLRGGDRPKNAEVEFYDVSSMAKGCYEPWGIFRKPMPTGMTVSDCLRKHGTGGIRRTWDGRPFEDVIPSGRTLQSERAIANHPSLKPQAFLRHVVYSALPLGKGVILDPFMGSGSTIAAAEAVGYRSVGLERFAEYFSMAAEAIPKLKSVRTTPQLRIAEASLFDDE